MAKLDVGSSIPELKVTPDKYLTARYAGASGDFNPIHIDEEFARAPAEEDEDEVPPEPPVVAATGADGTCDLNDSRATRPAMVPATAPEEELEMDQDDLFPARRSSPLGLHRQAV